MCLNRNRKKPARLEKKQKNPFINGLSEIGKSKETWIITVFILLFIGAVIFAYWESMAYLVYNTGGI